ncbi:Josephin domain-containing 2 [Paragonimus heterotremus]|uniref:ubiquitinyl hydrolase 1 n=1 Tax=Paragonimus heterotremus TaxID=100268 RepID=A0A8J4TM02_9TREM|nr:Josephin domain-containing 2 [Paragonimus heterotremus]
MDCSKDSAVIYHEKQSKMLCCLHALNNVLQDKIFSKKSLDEIANNLSPYTILNPHRNVFGLGNYDANVLMVALQQCGYDIVWCDKRKSVQEHNLNFDNILGFILNTLSRRRLLRVPLPHMGSHWIAFRRLVVNGQSQYYDLDSKLHSPMPIAATDEQFVAYLEQRLREFPDTQLLFVVSSDALQQRSWTFNK